MPIEIEDDQQHFESTPVVKRTRIGEVTLIALIDKPEQRDVKKDGEVVLKPNGKPRQELVVHGIVLPGHSAPVGKRDEQWVPQPGDPVRMILRGGAYGAWIEARKAHRGGKLCVGDVVRQVVDHAQAYDANGAPSGSKITDQAAADALPRGRTVGFYGPLTLHEPKDAEWVAVAEQAHRKRHEVVLEHATTAPAPADAYGDAPF